MRFTNKNKNNELKVVIELLKEKNIITSEEIENKKLGNGFYDNKK